ncbi:MAG: biotin-independent malonate decarboxylase subunit beta [Terrimicrobiaceae bacterium]
MSQMPYHELKARERIRAIVDTGSFEEFIPPPERVMSTYLPKLGIPAAFDDGVAIGSALIRGQKVYLGAQTGQFVGGSVGEVHSAKLVGLLKAAARDKTPCVLLVESGGVRLHEGSSGEIGIAEAIRAVFACRSVGATTIAVIGSDIGAYGGMGILSACCDRRLMTEHGRLGISGPIVIEKWMGKEAYDSSDRALVWKTSGGKTRYILGDVDALVNDSTASVREGILSLLSKSAKPDLALAEARQASLQARLDRFGKVGHPDEIWAACGISDVAAATLDEAEEFVKSFTRKTP